MDRDRLLYTGHLARLAEITQVISPDRGYIFHNRLTHSLKVAQVTRRIVESLHARQPRAVAALGGLDADAAEAAALAHDLGHPPFGHIAEEELDHLVRAAGLADGFEGNAQSFRILCRLATCDALDDQDHSVPGLNWTRQSLDGVLKYPWGCGENPKKPKKWGFYESERLIFQWVRGAAQPFRRNALAEIMDWSDDITYALHDLWDFFAAGRLPVDRVATRGAEYQRFWSGVEKYKAKSWGAELPAYQRALDGLLDIFPFEGRDLYTDTQAQRAKMYTFTTSLISRYVDAIRLTPSGRAAVVTIPDEERREIEVLKQFIWQYVILNPDLALPQSGHRKAIRVVFRRLLLAVRRDNRHLFAMASQESLERTQEKPLEQVRFVADYVAGMTEHELMETYRQFEGR